MFVFSLKFAPVIGFAIFVLGQLSRSAAAAQPSAGSDAAQPPSALKPPADGEIPVAFLNKRLK